MTANTQLNVGTGGDTIQTIDNTTYKTQVVAVGSNTGANIAAVNSSGQISTLAVGGAASGSAVSGNPLLMGGSDGALARTLRTDSLGSLSVRTFDTLATGSITALNGTVTSLECDGCSTASIQILGTYVGTVTFEGSLDNTTWFLLNASPYPSGTFVTSTTSTGQWVINAAGVDYVRVRASAFTSGTINATIDVSSGIGIIGLVDALPAGTNLLGKVGIDQTTPGTTNLVSIGTTGTVALNAAIPAGTNLVGKVGLDQTTVGTTNAISLAQIGATTIVTGGVNGTQAVGGITAVNATSTGNPVHTGGIALVAANPTAAANGQRTAIATDKVGRLLTVLGHERTMTGCISTTITSSTTATTIVAAVASTFCDITHLSITNSSATATLVTLINNGVTFGVWSINANGSIVLSFPTPLAAGLINTAWTLTCGTSVASIITVAQFVKNT